jgi:hypothetical protein
MKKLITLALMIVLAMFVAGCGEKIVYLPATTEITQTPISAVDIAAQERIWLAQTGPVFADFIYLLVNIEAAEDSYSYLELSQAVDGMGITVDEVSLPSQRCKDLRDSFYDLAAPVYIYYDAMAKGDTETAQKALQRIIDLTNNGTAEQFGKDFGAMAVDLELVNELKEWMNGLLDDNIIA